MAQNYRDQDLRGRNFAGQNLTNADFSGADLSGADFSGANLTKANFSAAKLYSANFKQANLQHTDFRHSQCGPRGWVAALKIVLGFAVSFVFTFIAALFNAAFFYVSSRSNLSDQIIGIIGSSIIILTFVYILRKGINNQLLTILSFAFAFAFAVSVAFAVAFAFAGALAVAAAGAFAFTGVAADVIAFAFAFAFVGAVAGAVATALFVLGVALRTHKGDPKFALLHGWGVRIGIIGSTSFYGATLSHADFGAANLRFADFRRAIFTGTNWANAKKLELAQFDRDYLNTPALRTLAIQRDGRGQVYDGINLSGLNLAGAQLQRASFVSANLNHVNLQAADLSEAVLKQTQLDGANLSAANLSGATIEDWGITVKTQLDDIRYTHVYMWAAGAGITNHLCKPDNENEVYEVFAEGEFAEFIRPLTDTLDLYHSQGVDPRVMSAAIKHMSERYPEAGPQIVAMERRGQYGFNVRVQVTTEADKSALSADYFAKYKQFKALAEAEKQTLIARLDVNMIKAR